MPEPGQSDIVKCGYLRKVKSVKSRYFVLRSATEHGPARLEYYGSRRRLEQGAPPRQSLPLADCLQVGEGLTLHFRSGTLVLSAPQPTDLEQWRRALLSLAPAPLFDEVWAGRVRGKGLGAAQASLQGPYQLGLSPTTLVFFRVASALTLTFPLKLIRKCGHSGAFFCVELGRSAVTGPGELWLQTDSSNTARAIHEAVLRAMKLCKSQPRPRSATDCVAPDSSLENSEPSTVISSSSPPSPPYLPMDTSSPDSSSEKGPYLPMRRPESACSEYLPMCTPPPSEGYLSMKPGKRSSFA